LPVPLPKGNSIKKPLNDTLNKSSVSTTSLNLSINENEPNKNKSNNIAMLNILIENKAWNFAINDLKEQFKQINLDLLKNYSLIHYYKKVTFFKNLKNEILIF
jgi:hypothetical protein